MPGHEVDGVVIDDVGIGKFQVEKALLAALEQLVSAKFDEDE